MFTANNFFLRGIVSVVLALVVSSAISPLAGNSHHLTCEVPDTPEQYKGSLSVKMGKGQVAPVTVDGVAFFNQHFEEGWNDCRDWFVLNLEWRSSSDLQPWVSGVPQVANTARSFGWKACEQRLDTLIHKQGESAVRRNLQSVGRYYFAIYFFMIFSVAFFVLYLFERLTTERKGSKLNNQLVDRL